jgi:hypothetical protein
MASVWKRYTNKEILTFFWETTKANERTPKLRNFLGVHWRWFSQFRKLPITWQCALSNLLCTIIHFDRNSLLLYSVWKILLLLIRLMFSFALIPIQVRIFCTWAEKIESVRYHFSECHFLFPTDCAIVAMVTQILKNVSESTFFQLQFGT